MNNLKNIMDDLIKISENNSNISESDYIGEDGLIYCGKCHTPKQCRISFMGEIKTPFCICKCEAQKIEKEQQEKERMKFESRVRDLRKDCFSDLEMVKWNFANDDLSNERITKAMQKYVENFDKLRLQGKGLLLYGNVGTGKTYAACEVANALVEKGYSCYVTNFSRVLNGLSGTYDKQAYLDDLNLFQLLIIDDLAAERSTEFAKEQIFNVIDERYRANLPMIITTNLTFEQIKNPQTNDDKRVFDRILERCYPIEVIGQSRRKKNFANDYSDMKNILGV